VDVPCLQLPCRLIPPTNLTALPTFTPIPALTQPSTSTLPAATISLAFCDDPRGRELINSFGAAIASKDGSLLASLVSPVSGMDVRFYRDGNVVNYDMEHAEFVFETTFQADWGLSFGSGEPTLGSFQEIILPSLQQVFISSAVLVCNQIEAARLSAFGPYSDMNYYSDISAPMNTAADWETLVGMDNVAVNHLALVHFVWEP
jgi:hypothetical protein